MQYAAANFRVQGRLGDHIHLSTEDFLESCLQTARKKRRSIGAAINQKIEVAVVPTLAAGVRTEDAEVGSAVAASGVKNGLSLRE